MANFKLEDYEPVEARIKRFYADHPDGAIHADLLTDPNNLDVAVVKAYIHVDGKLVATGMAFEKAGEGFVNKTSHLENCETSAIGRGLANFNYSGDKRPSREEMQKASQPREVARGATQADELVSKLNQALENGMDKGVYDTWMANVKRAASDKTLLATMSENIERLLYQSKVPAGDVGVEPDLPGGEPDQEGDSFF